MTIAAEFVSRSRGRTTADCLFKLVDEKLPPGQLSQIIRGLIQMGVDLDCQSRGGLGTALCIAASRGNVALVEELFLQGSKLIAVNKYRQSSMHLAAMNGHCEAVTALIAMATPSEKLQIMFCQDAVGETPLSLASCNGHSTCVQAIREGLRCTTLTFSSLLTVRNFRGETPLHLAAANGQVECIHALLQDIGDSCCQLIEDVGMPQIQGFGSPVCRRETPLFLAAKHGRSLAVASLLSHGADVNAKNIYGETPLFAAAENGSAECVTILVEDSRADVACTNSDNLSPITIASINGHALCIEALLARGSKHFVEGYSKAFLAAAQFGQTKSLQVLLPWLQKTLPEAVLLDLVHEAVLFSVKSGSLTTVKYVLSNRESFFGNTVTLNQALCEASSLGHVEIVRSLLSAGADAAFDSHGRSAALEAARKNRQLQVAELLEVVAAVEQRKVLQKGASN